jgi:hypothetical protein
MTPKEEGMSGSEYCFAFGWHPASEPPDDDRVVQVAWDDGSTGDASFAFYDSKAMTPPEEEKYWWSYPGMSILPVGHVLAWREQS